MLNIQVLGRGAIPRGQGIAPRKDPFPADLKTIELILNTPGLSIKFVNPITGVLLPLDTHNLKKMWKAYGNVKTTPTKKNQLLYSAPVKVDDKPILREATTKDFSEAINTVMNSAKNSTVAPKAEETPAVVKKDDKKKEYSKTDSIPVVKTEEQAKAEEPKTDNKSEENKNQSFKPVNAPDKK